MLLRRLVPGLVALACCMAVGEVAAAQCKVGSLQAENPQPGDQFGWEIDSDGETLVVNVRSQRALNVYRLEGSHPLFLNEVHVADAVYDIDVRGDWLAVGTPGAWVGAHKFAGAVSLFRRMSGTWTFVQQVVSESPNQSDGFGMSVALSDKFLVVGVPGESNVPAGSVYEAGAAEVFELHDAEWRPFVRLTEPQPIVESCLGQAVAIDGSTLMVGAPAGSFTFHTCRVQVYELETTGQVSEWKHKQTLSTPFGEGHGASIALRGDKVAVGAPGYPDTASGTKGKVYLYEKGPAGWVLQQVVIHSDATSFWGGSDFFGWALAINDTSLWAAAFPIDPLVGHQVGAVYEFREVDGAWTQAIKLVPVTTAGNGFFPYQIESIDGLLFLGAPIDGELNFGEVLIYEPPQDVVQFCSCGSPATCGNIDGHGGCANSTGFGSELYACGNGGIRTDGLVMSVTSLPANQPVLAFMGPASTMTYAGDGWLCVARNPTGHFFFAPQSSTPSGTAQLGPGIVAYSHASNPPAGQIQPGDTWYFQFWYRDPNGPCGSGGNLTNALRVDFKP
jgi:hypothetical protein